MTQHTPGAKLTKAQRIALEAARDFGNPNAYACPENPRGWTVHPYRARRFFMFDEMRRAGLLDDNHNITDAGRAAIAKAKGVPNAN